MLPFLKRKQDSVAGLIIKNRTPDKPNESEDLESAYSLEDCAQDIIDAIHSKDKSALASALKEALQKIEDEPQEKSSEPSPHSYEAQNEQAAQNNKE